MTFAGIIVNLAGKVVNSAGKVVNLAGIIVTFAGKRICEPKNQNFIGKKQENLMKKLNFERKMKGMI